MTKKSKKQTLIYNEPFPVTVKGKSLCEYYYKSDHRDGTKVKSQWTIKPPKELSAFLLGRQNNWEDGNYAWGLHLTSSKAQTLGKNDDGDTLNVAIFEGVKQNSLWHGYPADFKRNKFDLPPMKILIEWRTNKYFKKDRILKATRGKVCSL